MLYTVGVLSSLREVIDKRSFYHSSGILEQVLECHLSRCGSVTLEGKQHSVVFLHSRAAALPQGKANGATLVRLPAEGAGAVGRLRESADVTPGFLCDTSAGSFRLLLRKIHLPPGGRLKECCCATSQIR